jgi:four helix bundle protein
MGVYQVEDFAAYDFAVRFKQEVYRLINGSREASRNLKYRGQLEEAASGIEGAMSEGFGRRRPREFALYLRYSLGSLNEARTRLRDGIDRGYFTEAACSRHSPGPNAANRRRKDYGAASYGKRHATTNANATRRRNGKKNRNPDLGRYPVAGTDRTDEQGQAFVLPRSFPPYLAAL